MTNEDALNSVLRKAFSNTIFIRSIDEVNQTQAIHFSEEWLNKEYKLPEDDIDVDFLRILEEAYKYRVKRG